jgi:hypothetical protein
MSPPIRCVAVGINRIETEPASVGPTAPPIASQLDTQVPDEQPAGDPGTGVAIPRGGRASRSARHAAR